MTKKPNILLFLTDDHAQWASGFYGEPDIITPNLDYLAEKGVLMENAFTPTPVCSPGRACLLTGRIASQHGIHDYLGSAPDVDIDQYPWLAGERLLPEILQKAGYATALSGKWHLGQEAHPQGGFDRTFSNGPQYPFDHGGSRTFFQNGQPVEMRGYKTRIITDQALNLLRSRPAEKPFYLQIGYIATHNPWEGHPERLVSHYRNCPFEGLPNDAMYPFGIQNLESTFSYRYDQQEARAQYFAAVTQIDEGIGRILDALDSLGLLEDTLIIYTSDHGLNCGHHGIWGKGNGTLPLNLVEESIRIPMILHHPGKLLGQQRRLEFVDHTDLFQTILDLAKIELTQEEKTNRNYPGRSFAPLLTQERPLMLWRTYQICEYGLVRMIRNQRYKLIRRYPDGPHLFFDLHKDPREEQNLFGFAKHRQRIEDMTQSLEEFFLTFADERNNGLNVRQLPVHNASEAWRDPRNLD